MGSAPWYLPFPCDHCSSVVLSTQVFNVIVHSYLNLLFSLLFRVNRSLNSWGFFFVFLFLAWSMCPEDSAPCICLLSQRHCKYRWAQPYFTPYSFPTIWLLPIKEQVSTWSSILDIALGPHEYPGGEIQKTVGNYEPRVQGNRFT